MIYGSFRSDGSSAGIQASIKAKDEALERQKNHSQCCQGLYCLFAPILCVESETCCGKPKSLEGRAKYHKEDVYVSFFLCAGCSWLFSSHCGSSLTLATYSLSSVNCWSGGFNSRTAQHIHNHNQHAECCPSTYTYMPCANKILENHVPYHWVLENIFCC